MNNPKNATLKLLMLVCILMGATQAQSVTYTINPSNDTSGATDSTAITNTVRNNCLTATVHGCTIYLNGPLYITDVNLTNLYRPGIIFVGTNTYSNSTSSGTPTITVTGVGSQGFDLSGTSTVTFKDLSMAGASGSSMPASAIFASRTSASGESFSHLFDNVSFYGSFTQAAVYDYAGEGWKFLNSSFDTADGHGGYFTSKNSLGLVSKFVTTSTSTPSMTLTSFENSVVQIHGAGKHCLWFEGNGIAPNSTVETINIRDSYFTASSTGLPPGSCLQFDDVMGGITFSGNRDETAASGKNGNAAFAVFTSSVSGSVVNGIDWRGNQFYSNNYIIDASLANLYNVSIKNNKAPTKALTYLFNKLNVADIGPLTDKEKVQATGSTYGVFIPVAYQTLLSNISLPVNSNAIVGDERFYVYLDSNTSPVPPAITITSGNPFSYPMPDYIQRLVINPAGGSVASANITTPPHPVDGQKLIISATWPIPTLTITANAGQTVSGAPTSIPANNAVAMQYLAAYGFWFRVQ